MDLPLIYEEPIFKEEFMIYYDKEKDAVRLVKDTTIAIVGSVAITVKDVSDSPTLSSLKMLLLYLEIND